MSLAVPRRFAVPLAAALVSAGVAAVAAGPAHAEPLAAADGTVAHRFLSRAAARSVAVDPRLPEAWHLDGDGPMGVRAAWRRTVGGDVTVAVLDTGIDTRHPDLAPNLWTNPGEVPGNGLDDDADGTVDDIHGVDLVNRDGDPQDDNGHGTHVSGIIGARGGNDAGATGVAWRVRLMSVKVLDAGAAGNTDTVARGLEWAVAHGARVINLSLTGDGRSRALERAIAAAQAAGVLVVVAAGNNARDLGLLPSYPASYPAPNVLGVAATDAAGGLAGVSSFGSGVDLSAPGDRIFSTALGGGYERRTGTSMAAPMVAGAAALVLSLRPGIDAAGLMTALTGSARRTGLAVGSGALDAGAAVGATPAPVAAPAIPAAAPVAGPPRAMATTARARVRAARTRALAKSKARARAKAKAGHSRWAAVLRGREGRRRTT